jgi:immune inhibitor A
MALADTLLDREEEPMCTALEIADRVRRFRVADRTRCAVAPHPDAEERIKAALEQARGTVDDPLAALLTVHVEPHVLGNNDGVIVPPEEFPIGTPLDVISAAAADRAPLRGTVRVIVVLVEFSDSQIGATLDRFRDLFFSTGVIPTGSVRE